MCHKHSRLSFTLHSPAFGSCVRAPIILRNHQSTFRMAHLEDLLPSLAFSRLSINSPSRLVSSLSLLSFFFHLLLTNNQEGFRLRPPSSPRSLPLFLSSSNLRPKKHLSSLILHETSMSTFATNSLEALRLCSPLSSRLCVPLILLHLQPSDHQLCCLFGQHPRTSISFLACGCHMCKLASYAFLKQSENTSTSLR